MVVLLYCRRRRTELDLPLLLRSLELCHRPRSLSLNTTALFKERWWRRKIEENPCEEEEEDQRKSGGGRETE